jgi:hypothetical protein
MQRFLDISIYVCYMLVLFIPSILPRTPFPSIGFNVPYSYIYRSTSTIFTFSLVPSPSHDLFYTVVFHWSVRILSWHFTCKYCAQIRLTPYTALPPFTLYPMLKFSMLSCSYTDVLNFIMHIFFSPTLNLQLFYSWKHALHMCVYIYIYIYIYIYKMLVFLLDLHFTWMKTYGLCFSDPG